MNCMEDFASFIRTVPYKSASPVKIAVLDYGFDDALDGYDDKFAWVKSFCPGQTPRDMMNTYISDRSGQHWTRMSALISHICPKSRLYVGLLGYSKASNGGLQVTARSAAQVRALFSKR